MLSLFATAVGRGSSRSNRANSTDDRPIAIPVVVLMAISVIELGRHLALLSWTMIVAIFSASLGTKYAFVVMVTAFGDALLLTCVAALTLRSLFGATSLENVRWYQRLALVLNLVTLSGRFETVGVASLQLWEGTGTGSWTVYIAHSIDMGVQIAAAVYRAVWLVKYGGNLERRLTDNSHMRDDHEDVDEEEPKGSGRSSRDGKRRVKGDVL